jgi:hypothetical protein
LCAEFLGKYFVVVAWWSYFIRRALSKVFQALNENKFNPRILCPAKLSFKIDGTIKFFHDKQKLKPYMISKPPLQKNHSLQHPGTLAHGKPPYMVLH